MSAASELDLVRSYFAACGDGINDAIFRPGA